jgi:hypothetical protein
LPLWISGSDLTELITSATMILIKPSGVLRSGTGCADAEQTNKDVMLTKKDKVRFFTMIGASLIKTLF